MNAKFELIKCKASRQCFGIDGKESYREPAK